MLVYRIDRLKYQDTVLSGEGAMHQGGRWNHKNTPAVYAAATRSLAMLEILVHIRQIGLMPKDRIIVTIKIPDEAIAHITTDQLIPTWNQRPHGPTSNKDLLQTEVIDKQKLGLAVPSVIVPQEINYVLYPQARLFKKVKIIDIEPLEWDYRL